VNTSEARAAAQVLANQRNAQSRKRRLIFWANLAPSLRHRLDQVWKRYLNIAGFRKTAYSLPSAQAASPILGCAARSQPEAWICFSSMSYQLFSTWKAVSHVKAAWVFIPSGSVLHDDQSPVHHSESSNMEILPYTQLRILLLCASRLFSLSRLTVRVAHLHPSTIKQILIFLNSLGLLKLELYDDGFLGVLEDPSVCKYLKPIFSSLCCWDIDNWSMSPSVYGAVHRHGGKPLQVFKLPIGQAVESWLPESPAQSPGNVMIIESKYMDYALLARLITESWASHDADADIHYLQHPWEIKRNNLWPEKYRRKFISSIPIEKHLVSVLGNRTHVIAGMTSTTIFLCELVKRGLVPRHCLTLLVRENASSLQFFNKTEPSSYCQFMQVNYSQCVDLRILYNGAPFGE